MTNEKVEGEQKPAEPVSAPLSKRALEFAQRAWRPSGTVVAVCLALMLMGHVVNGKNGLTVWRQKRAEDKQLQKEIKELEEENARLREHVERLKSDPGAIEHEAREKLHYAKPNEVIVALPPQPKDSPIPAPSH
ncbi:MAG TPA: septum formation initiator family protein [Terracidiphilus sp.]|nr:septum formation initiator family protein [Terracidiphilus sp.]